MGKYTIGECGNCGRTRKLMPDTDTCTDCHIVMQARIEEIRAECAARRGEKDAQTPEDQE